MCFVLQDLAGERRKARLTEGNRKSSTEKCSAKLTSSLYLYNRSVRRLVIFFEIIRKILSFFKQVNKTHPHNKQLNDWVRSELVNGGFPKVNQNSLTFTLRLYIFRIKIWFPKKLTTIMCPFSLDLVKVKPSSM